jgi:ADP-ribose pyrophosphatase
MSEDSPRAFEPVGGETVYEGRIVEVRSERFPHAEIGLGAEHWEPILAYYSSAGFTDERVHLFLASALHEESAESGENERIEIVRWPLGDLDGAISQCEDAKTLIGLMWLARELNGPLHPQGGLGAEAKPAG